MTAVVQCALFILAFLPLAHPCGMEIASPRSKVVIGDYATMSTACQNEITGCSARLLPRQFNTKVQSGSHRPDLELGGKWFVYHHRLVGNIDCLLVLLARLCQFQSLIVTSFRNFDDEECPDTRISFTVPLNTKY